MYLNSGSAHDMLSSALALSADEMQVVCQQYITGSAIILQCISGMEAGTWQSQIHIANTSGQPLLGQQQGMHVSSHSILMNGTRLASMHGERCDEQLELTCIWWTHVITETMDGVDHPATMKGDWKGCEVDNVMHPVMHLGKTRQQVQRQVGFSKVLCLVLQQTGPPYLTVSTAVAE